MVRTRVEKKALKENLNPRLTKTSTSVSLFSPIIVKATQGSSISWYSIIAVEVEEKIISLETKLAYMEDFVNQLQAVSVEHTETIERLRTENKLLSQKLHEVSDILEGDIPNRKPPHY